MKKKKLKLFLLLSISILILSFSLSGCGKEKEEPVPDPQTVSIWYVKSTVTSGIADAVTASFSYENDGYYVSLRAFDTESLMAQALDESRPDLIVCSYERASILYGGDHLADLSDCGIEYGCVFSDDSGMTGSAFFPLYGSVDVLYVNDSLWAETHEDELSPDQLATVSSICSAAIDYTRLSGSAFFAADNYAPVFAACLRQSGSTFNAVRNLDTASSDYVAMYNLFAEAAHEKAISVSDTSAKTLVSEGTVVCGLIPSYSAVNTGEGFSVYPAFQHDLKSSLSCAAVTGIAVTSENGGAEACADVISRIISSGSVYSCAVENGYLSFSAPSGESGSMLEDVLRGIYSDYTIYIPAYDTGYYENASGFNTEFKTAMQLLINS